MNLVDDTMNKAKLSMYAVQVLVTPQLAEQWLRNQAPNRSVSEVRVKDFAQQMRDGRWMLSPQPICTDIEGRVIDGQHRLLAVIASGVSVTMLVVYNVPAESQHVIDRVRPRRNVDDLKMAGIEDGVRLVAWTNTIHAILHSLPFPESLPFARLMDYREQYAADIAWAQRDLPRAAKHARAPVCGALVFAHRAFPVEVEAFGKKYATGANLSDNEPAFLLRRFVLERLPLTKESAMKVAQKTLRAVMCDVRHEPIMRLEVNRESASFFATAQGLTIDSRVAP